MSERRHRATIKVEAGACGVSEPDDFGGVLSSAINFDQLMIMDVSPGGILLSLLW
jgi:hypothetical protein